MKYNKLSILAISIPVASLCLEFISPHGFPFVYGYAAGIVLGIVSMRQINKTKEKGWLISLAAILFPFAATIVMASFALSAP